MPSSSLVNVLNNPNYSYYIYIYQDGSLFNEVTLEGKATQSMTVSFSQIKNDLVLKYEAIKD